jgi:hypothetical protein
MFVRLVGTSTSAPVLKRRKSDHAGRINVVPIAVIKLRFCLENLAVATRSLTARRRVRSLASPVRALLLSNSVP